MTGHTIFIAPPPTRPGPPPHACRPPEKECPLQETYAGPDDDDTSCWRHPARPDGSLWQCHECGKVWIVGPRPYFSGPVCGRWVAADQRTQRRFARPWRKRRRWMEQAKPAQ